jgi:hypothetical protein
MLEGHVLVWGLDDDMMMTSNMTFTFLIWYRNFKAGIIMASSSSIYS